MKRFKNLMMVLTAVVMGLTLAGCDSPPKAPDNGGAPQGGENGVNDNQVERPADDNGVTDIEVDDKEYDYTLDSGENGNFVYKDEEGNVAEFSVICNSGTDLCYSVEENTLTFSGITENSVYSLTGEFYGNIVIDATEDYKFELELNSFSITSYNECPINILSGDKVTLSAKKETENYIYDLREEVDDEGISASVYAQCDLNVQGKGELYVKSVNNNGIHTKDDLALKNLTLQVDCKDNALKGNDSVTIESGNLILIARSGDGIKTSNSDVSSKGNQRGTVSIQGGSLLIYAACDGIDASYDVVISDETSVPDIRIYTDKYSEYSEEVTATSESVYYIRFNSTSYKYSIYYFNDENSGEWCNSSDYTTVSAGMSKYYYYPIAKPSGYSYLKVYIYSSSQEQGQGESYVACTDSLTVNNNYDTFALQSRGNSLSYGWTNYSTSPTGGMGGMGGPSNDGNTDKGDYSTKGLKADNQITISAGYIQISSYDDAIHANSDVALENGQSPLGNVTVSGGTLALYTNDDGIHADGTVEITGGEVCVGGSYEGIEGSFVRFVGGNVSVTASDDGVNGTATSGESIVVSGGTLYVCAGGDGLDSNSTTSYGGISFKGGKTVVISTGSADASIDSERGYNYSGGYVLAIGKSGGMSSESTSCSPDLSTVGVKATLNLSSESYLTVENYVTVKLPYSINALVVFIGDSNASVKSATTTELPLDSNGVCWSV
ncbi:MAG: carbohydrate-binding domain-containing protein [Candidatus Coproplasma sp.]